MARQTQEHPRWLRTVLPRAALLSGSMAALGCTAELEGDDSSGTDTTVASEVGTVAPGTGDFEPLGGSREVVCDPTTASLTPPRLHRLTRRMYDRTVASLVGDTSAPAAGFVPEPGSEQGFQNDASQLRVRLTEAGEYRNAAKRLAAEVAGERLASVFPCDAAQLEDAACGVQFVLTFGERAFRRPLTDAEETRYKELFAFAQGKGGGQLAVEATIEAMLQSPHFLYRSELGAYSPENPGATALTDDETASLLSYTLTEGPPDDELRALAKSGELTDPTIRRREGERLLATETGRAALVEFLEQLFEYEGLPNNVKDPEVFPEFEGLKADMSAEFVAFAGHVLSSDAPTFLTFMTAPYTKPSSALALHYGGILDPVTGLMPLDPAEKKGILSLSGQSAVLSATTRTSPVNRGRFVRERLLCEHISDPPPNTDTTLPTLSPGLSARQQLDERTSAPSCTTCHSLMNPVGFGLESIDPLGRYRTSQNGVAIDDSGAFTSTRDIDGEFAGVVGLADKLASSSQVSECIAIQAFRYGSGRGENDGDSCAVTTLREKFVASGLGLDELFLALIEQSTFTERAPLAQ